MEMPLETAGGRCALVLVVLLTLQILACGPRDLTRAGAAELLQKHGPLSSPVNALSLQDEGRARGKHDAGEIEGLWTSSEYRFALTAKGREHFAHDFSANEGVPLREPGTREVIEITGITTPQLGGPNTRMATFNWRYKGLDNVVARYTGETSAVHHGEAAFQLFDDGWRVSEVQLNEHQDRNPFQWPPELEKRLEQIVEAGRLSADQALALATPALLSVEPVLNLNVHPAWNIPSVHGLTGQRLTSTIEKVTALEKFLKDHGVSTLGHEDSGGYIQVKALEAGPSWSTSERNPRYTGDKSYAVFSARQVRLVNVKQDSPDSDEAVSEVEVTYSGCTPACELAKALENYPTLDYGGGAMDKVFYAYQPWKDRDSGKVFFKRSADGSWRVSGTQ